MRDSRGLRAWNPVESCDGLRDPRVGWQERECAMIATKQQSGEDTMPYFYRVARQQGRADVGVWTTVAGSGWH